MKAPALDEIRKAGEPQPPTLDEIRRSWPPTVSIPTAAPVIGISSSYLYELAGRNEAPVRVLKIGSRYRVVTASLVALLEGGDSAPGT